MLGYEWANPAAVLLSYDPSEAAAQEQPHHPRHPMLPLYDRGCLDLAGALFPSAPPPPVPVGAAGEADYSLHHYGGISLPPAPPAQPAMRIGLNLGVRTYFSSSPDGELMRLGRNVYRRSGGEAGGGVLSVLGGGGIGGAAASRARCQAEGCGADLTRAKHYHRRHKVCEYHSKAAAVVAHGLTQRFCQQCSRFHVLSEFDQGKRSCRKRLADHNRRRRKTQPLPPLLPPPSQSDDSTAAAPTAASPAKVAAETKPPAEDAPPATFDGAPPPAAADALAAPASPTWMALGRCLRSPGDVPGANSSSSSSSTSSCSSSSSSVMQHLADFRGVPMSIWDAGVHGGNGHRAD